MAVATSPPARGAGGPVLLRERFLSGSIRGEYYDHSLNVTLTPRLLRLEPSLLAGRRPGITLPLDAIILAHVHRSRLTPRLELYFETRYGSGVCAFSPRDLRLWVEYFDELGVLLRPRPLDVKALPCHNLGYRARLVTLAAIGIAGAVGLAVGVVRLVVGG
jgi:hypothetical protein